MGWIGGPTTAICNGSVGIVDDQGASIQWGRWTCIHGEVVEDRNEADIANGISDCVASVSQNGGVVMTVSRLGDEVTIVKLYRDVLSGVSDGGSDVNARSYVSR